MSNSSSPGANSFLEDVLSTVLNVSEHETSTVLASDSDNITNNNYASAVVGDPRNDDWNLLHKHSLSEIANGEDDLTPLLGVQKPKQSCSNCCCDFIRSITVEPWLFVVMFATFLQSVVMKNLIIQKVCIFTFGVNNTDCMNTTNATMENFIQVQASNIEMYNSLVETVPAIFFSIFLGAFSDRHSRKIPMLIPVIGCTVSSIAVLFCAYFMEEVPPQYLPLTGIPKGLTGGIIAAMVAALSYVSDLSAPDKRTVRVAAVEGVLLLGQPIGTLAGGRIYQYSYVLVYIIGTASYLACVVYIVAVIKEPETQQVGKQEKTSFCKKFFNLASYKETLVTIFKLRDGNGRFYILMLIGVMTFFLIPYIGQSTILYLFLRLKFHWDLTKYSYFSALSSVSTSLGIFFGAVILVKILKLNDMILGFIGIFGALSVSLSFSFINSASMMYIVCVPLLLCGITSLAVRSTISKLVPRDEQGKVFSVLGSCEAITPFLSSLLYTQVYNASVATFPETVFIMSVGILIIPLIILIIVSVNMLRSSYRQHSAF